MRICLVDGCSKPSKTRGMCGMHTERIRSGTELIGPERWSRLRPFQDYVERSEGCWTWTGSISAEGYGRYGALYAHRLSYEQNSGASIPDGLVVDHLCRNRSCVRPDHLEAVPQQSNVLRGIAPNATAIRTGFCKRGHPRTPENTYIQPSNGYARCLVCQRNRDGRRRAR